MTQPEKIILTLVAILVPVIGPAIVVGIKEGFSTNLLIALLLGLCFHLPGVLFAIWILWRELPTDQGTEI